MVYMRMVARENGVWKRVAEDDDAMNCGISSPIVSSKEILDF
jgi:hypothetical protein